jgi:hypothetical protein
MYPLPPIKNPTDKNKPTLNWSNITLANRRLQCSSLCNLTLVQGNKAISPICSAWNHPTPNNFIEKIIIKVVILDIHGSLKKGRKNRVGFWNPLRTSYFLLDRKFGGILVKIPVGF